MYEEPEKDSCVCTSLFVYYRTHPIPWAENLLPAGALPLPLPPDPTEAHRPAQRQHIVSMAPEKLCEVKRALKLPGSVDWNI